jgi:hypothetical protein
VRAFVTALVLLIASVAVAQIHLPARQFAVQWDRGAPRVSFSAKDLADDRVRQELSSGLRKRLVVHVSSHFKSSNWSLVKRSFSCDITKDLWDDGYLVRIGSRSERVKTLDKVLSRCLDVVGLFVGEPKNYVDNGGKEIYFYVRAEFNPISKKQCSELIRPTSSDDPVGPITVNIVRRRICQAERTLEFRSEVMKVPE